MGVLSQAVGSIGEVAGWIHGSVSGYEYSNISFANEISGSQRGAK
jgi:hypothetical protein